MRFAIGSTNCAPFRWNPCWSQPAANATIRTRPSGSPPRARSPVTGMKFMNWNQGRGGGGAIDLAMHLNGLDFKAAIDWLCGHFPIPLCSQPRPTPRSLILPLPDRSKLRAVQQYLVQDRGITLSLVDSLVESGRLY